MSFVNRSSYNIIITFFRSVHSVSPWLDGSIRWLDAPHLGWSTVNRAVDPSGVSKLVALNIQRVTTVEGWEGTAYDYVMAGARLM